jgi:hypothetical protein
MTGTRRLQPSLFDFVFVLWVTVIPIALGNRLLSTDGDLPRHLRLGEWMIANRAMLTVDNFSFTRGGQPFVAFEWGSEVIYAAVHRLGGLAGVAVLAGMVLAFTYALLIRFLLSHKVEPLLAYLTVMAAALLGASHWVARPHLFTMLLVVILLTRLEEVDQRPLWWFAPLFWVWSNIHGGFVYGLLLIGMYVAGDLVEWLINRRSPVWRNRLGYHGLALLLAIGGVILNANGYRLFVHLVAFFGQPLLMEKTQEFNSPDFHVLNGKLFLYALLIILTGLALTRRRPSAPHLFVLLGNIAFSLQAQRNVELFALTALPLMAWHLDPDWGKVPGLGRIRRAFAQESDAQYRGVPSVIFSVEVVVLALFGARVGGREIITSEFDPKIFPVAAVARAREEKLTGRIYSEFIWGGYILYAWPEQQVFIDGGTDHYGEALVQQHIQLATLQPEWRDVLTHWNISLALLATDAPLAHELVREPGWRVRFCDPTAVLLERSDVAADSLERSSAELMDCYHAKQKAEHS